MWKLLDLKGRREHNTDARPNFSDSLGDAGVSNSLGDPGTPADDFGAFSVAGRTYRYADHTNTCPCSVWDDCADGVPCPCDGLRCGFRRGLRGAGGPAAGRDPRRATPSTLTDAIAALAADRPRALASV